MPSARPTALIKSKSRRTPLFHLLALAAVLAGVLMLGQQPAQARNATDDISLHTDNASARDMWSDGTTMWVLDSVDDEIYAYTLATWARDASNDFNTLTAAGNTTPLGIWSDGTTMWVADSSDNKVYAYKMSDKSRDSAKEFNLHSGNGNARGLWSDGTTMWVSNNSPANSGDKVFAYKLADGTRDSGKDFGALNAAGNNAPYGMWSDGKTMWIVDSDDDKVYAYKVSDQSRDPVRDFDLDPGNAEARGMWGQGQTLYVSDPDDDRVYIYGRPVVVWEATLTAKPHNTNNDLDGYGGSFSNSSLSPSTFTIGSNTYAVELFQLNSSNKTLSFRLATNPTQAEFNALSLIVEGEEFPLRFRSNTGAGRRFSTWPNSGLDAWTDGEMLSVGMQVGSIAATGRPTISGTPTVRQTLRASISSVADANGLPDKASDFAYQWVRVDGMTETDVGTNATTYRLVAADEGKTIKVKVSFTDKHGFDEEVVSAESAAIAAALADISLHSDNSVPRGVWSDGTTIWVSNNFSRTGSGNKLFAYTLVTGARDAGRDFSTLSAAGNESPEGIWSDGTTMWVADRTDNKVYAYKMSDKSNDSTKEFNLDSDNTLPAGLWSDGTTMWVLDNGLDKIFAYTLSSGTRDSGKDFGTLSAAGNNGPYGIRSDGATMWITDSDDEKVYAYKVSDKSRDADMDFGLTSNNGDPFGMWGQGRTFYVADEADAMLYRYDHPRVVWSATLTPKEHHSNTDDIGYGSSTDYPSSALSPPTFVRNSTTFTVTELTLVGATNPTLTFTVGNIDLDYPVLVLDVDGEEFVLPSADVTLTSTSSRFRWTSTSLSWSDGTNVAVSLKALNTPATGAPLIAGAPFVGTELTAHTLGIVDPNGVPQTADSYQWIRVDGTNETDISGAESATYTPVEDDKGNTLKVRVTFTDLDGFYEGTFTSDATPEIGAANEARGIWSAVLPVQQFIDSGASSYGWDSSRSDEDLTDDEFDLGGKTYALDAIYWAKDTLSGSFTAEDLRLDFTTAGAGDIANQATRYKLDLHVANGIYSLRSATLTSGRQLTWPISGLDWSMTNYVPLAIALVNIPAAGAPTITGPVAGTVQVGHMLTAHAQGITDPNGVPENAFSYQWVRVDGGSEADISGAEAATYDVVEDDDGKMLKVRVTFTDGDGFKEELTSAATWEVGTFNICDRSWWVQSKILRLTPSNDSCDRVLPSELAAITTLDFSDSANPGVYSYVGQTGNVIEGNVEVVTVHRNTAHLREWDFDGMTGLRTLNLSDRCIGLVHKRGTDNKKAFAAHLAPGLFSDLANLRILRLRNNNLGPGIPEGAFENLGNLTTLDLRSYSGVDNTPGRKSCQTPYQRRVSNYDAFDASPLAFVPLASLTNYNGRTFTAIAAPENLSFTARPVGAFHPAHTVTLTWDAPTGVTGITGYRILRFPDGNPTDRLNPSRDEIGDTDAGVTYYVDGTNREIGFGSGWVAGTDLRGSFTYLVQAITAQGRSSRPG